MFRFTQLRLRSSANKNTKPVLNLLTVFGLISIGFLFYVCFAGFPSVSIMRFFKSFTIGFLVSFMSCSIIYFDSFVPGIDPPLPKPSNNYKLDLSYLIPMLNGVLVFFYCLYSVNLSEQLN